MYCYKAKLNRIIDGDTFVLAIDVGFEITINTHVRVLDLDTPEIFHSSCKAEKIHGFEAKLKASMLLQGKELTILTKKKGKYGRYLADIFIEPEGLNFADEMRKAGFQKKKDYLA
jgi:micrococcal nuclease